MTFEIATYDVGLLVVGVIALAAVLVPRVLTDRMISYPLVIVLAGVVVFALPLGLEPVHPLEHPELTEHLTEIAVIIALTALGLKIERPLSLAAWGTTWRLLAITMPVTIVVAALLGFWVAGLVPVAAVLLGAVIAPTDPVLAADVQVGPPITIEDTDDTEDADTVEADGEGGAREVDPTTAEDEVRFSLSSEAALNDGLAFPFTNAAIAMALVGTAPGNWVGRWLWLDVGYRIAAGLLLGWLVGRFFGWLLFDVAENEDRPFVVEELIVIAITLVSYGVAEVANGYGFIAVFVTAYTIRHIEREHGLHDKLHDAADQLERLVMTLVLFLLGGSLLAGLLDPLTGPLLIVGVLLVLVVRPVAGAIGLLGDRTLWFQRGIIAFFGIRGVGSFFYLAHGLNEADFPQARELWALVGFTALLSMTVHGLTATPVMKWFDAWREGRADPPLEDATGVQSP